MEFCDEFCFPHINAYFCTLMYNATPCQFNELYDCNGDYIVIERNFRNDVVLLYIHILHPWTDFIKKVSLLSERTTLYSIIMIKYVYFRASWIYSWLPLLYQLLYIFSCFRFYHPSTWFLGLSLSVFQRYSCDYTSILTVNWATVNIGFMTLDGCLFKINSNKVFSKSEWYGDSQFCYLRVVYIDMGIFTFVLQWESSRAE